MKFVLSILATLFLCQMPGNLTAPASINPAITAASGHTYHVASAGSDSNDGSKAAPWATLQHAVDNVTAGDVILVHAGTYAGARIEHSGTATDSITLRANTGERVLVNQPGPNNKHNSNLELETWEGDGSVAYWVIEGLEVSDAPNWGIDIRGNETTHSHYITICGNTVHDNGLSSGKTGIFAAFTDDTFITDNLSYHNGEHGIYVNNSSDRFTISGNTVYSNVNCGIHLNGDLDSGGDGVMTDGLVENNIIYENGTGGGAGINMDGVSDSIVINNLLYQNHASGIALFQENGSECSQNNDIWHNTILMPDDGRWAVIVANVACVNNRLYNNIFYTEHSYRGSINIPAGSVSGLESDYNIVVDRFTTDDGDSILTLAEWQALGYDTHAFIATPAQMFANPAGQNFHLFAESLAIDRGTALPALAPLTTDLSGNPRPIGSSPDIGAYEYQVLDKKVYLPLVITGATAPVSSTGHIYYTLGSNHHLYRLNVDAPDTPQDLSLALDTLATGGDEWGNVSPDGDWLLLSTQRNFHADCTGWACLVLLPQDLSAGEVLLTSNGVVHTEGFSAVASGGNMVIYVSNDGTHAQDLFAITRQDGGWSAPVLLTAASTYDSHTQPALSADGSKVLFDCDPNIQDGQQGTAICEVHTDGTNFRTVITPAQGPGGGSDNALHHPDYAPDGSIIFEADWQGEQIWRLSDSSGSPTQITTAFNNDNSPCVLPDGRIASLWLDRPGGQGYHELKIMSPDGSDYSMAFTDLDVFDAGLGCGE